MTYFLLFLTYPSGTGLVTAGDCLERVMTCTGAFFFSAAAAAALLLFLFIVLRSWGCGAESLGVVGAESFESSPP
jgi:tellurite resistance protein TehA-like permease